MIGLVFFGNETLYVLIYISTFVFLTIRVMITPGEGRIKKYLIITYAAVLILQIVLAETSIFSENVPKDPTHVIRRFFGAAALLLPMLVSRYVSVGKYARLYLPSVGEAAIIGFSELRDSARAIGRAAVALDQAGKNLSPENLKAVIADLPRHDSFNYINNGSLTPEYFAKAAESLSDPNIYIVISRTGSAASEIISVFTQKLYNHASISFDRDLQTVISYNGGERLYPPGLNMEMIEFFKKKPDAGILIYSLPCPREKKELILNKVDEINKEGSAYNMLGLVLKRSYRPNIMFCSQFVYRMLDAAGLSYFEKADGKVSPTDLIELDYYKKLRFEREIRLR
jgi:hypothetical protein